MQRKSQAEYLQRKRFSVKPCITCIWQIFMQRSNLAFNKWLELDLEYIENWSLRLDFMILLKTLPAVLKLKGAV
ncbi:MAG: sugar transferase [Desulfobulbaceae bacterium]|nr:sugar transferase [Desulfobulbaceae bacterium]